MENCNKYTILVKASYLMDYKPTLHCLTRFLNEKNNLNLNLSQSKLNQVSFNSIEDYVDQVFGKGCDIDENKRNEFVKFLGENELYSTIKPRLLFTFNLYVLIRTLVIHKLKYTVYIIYDNLEKNVIKESNGLQNVNRFIDENTNFNSISIPMSIDKYGDALSKHFEGIAFINETNNKTLLLKIKEIAADNEKMIISQTYEGFYTSILNEIKIDNIEEKINEYKGKFNY
jgi:hypothetical protein